MNIVSSKQRLLQYIDYKGIKVKDFYEKTSIKRGFLDTDKLHSAINDSFLAIIVAKFPDLNLTWLITGNGAMLVHIKDIGLAVSEAAAVYRTRTDTDITTQQIPLYSLEAAAGIVHLFKDSQQTKEYISIPNLPRCDGALYINGDSMYPLLKSGDIVMYKQINDPRTCTFIWGEMYLLSFRMDGDDFTTVKYIQKSEEGSDYIRLASQNPNHQPIDIPKKNIVALALVKASVRINSMN